MRSGDWPAWLFSFWFSGCWRALAKGTAWAGFYCAIHHHYLRCNVGGSAARRPLSAVALRFLLRFRRSPSKRKNLTGPFFRFPAFSKVFTISGRRAHSSTTRGAFKITCAIGNWNTRNKSEDIGEITAAKHAQFTRALHHTTFVEHDRAHIDATDHKPRQTRNNNNLPHNRPPSPDRHARTMLSHSTETKKQARNAT